MCQARNDRIFIVAKGTLIQRTEHTLHDTTEVSTHLKNVQIICSHLCNRLSIYAYYGCTNEAWNSVTQRFQRSNKSGVATFRLMLSRGIRDELRMLRRWSAL